MALLSDYTAGTVDLTTGTKTVTGSGTAWQTAKFQEGDWFLAGGHVGIIASVDDEDEITLVDNWAGDTLSDASYRLRYMSDGSRASAQARALINLLGDGTLAALAAAGSAAGKLPVYTGEGAAELATLTDGAKATLALDGAADKLAYLTGEDSAALTDITATARALLAAADAAAMRTMLGLGSAALVNSNIFALLDSAPTFTGRLTAPLMHTDGGGYFRLGAFGSSFGSGYAKILWDDSNIRINIYRDSDNATITMNVSITGTSGDYAEYFEWADGNPTAEDRRGLTVVLDEGKIRPATAADDPEDIIGAISAMPLVTGDAAEDNWTGKYLVDDYGTPVLDAIGQWQLNPDYDPDQPYVPRSERPEWDRVGLVGKLIIRAGQPVNSRWRRLTTGDDVERWFVR